MLIELQLKWCHEITKSGPAVDTQVEHPREMQLQEKDPD